MILSEEEKMKLVFLFYVYSTFSVAKGIFMDSGHKTVKSH